MRKFEYKAIPAPSAGTKAKGVKSTEDRFALSMTDVLNEMASDGWEYVRAEMLPCDERKGLTGTQRTYQNVLIFRRLEAEPLPLADSPRIRSVPSPQLAEPPRRPDPEPGPEPEAEPQSDPEPERVAVRRVTSQLAEEGKAPPLGTPVEERG